MIENEKVIRFTQEMTFRIIKKATDLGMSDSEISVILEFKNMRPSEKDRFPENCLRRPGYSKEHAKNILGRIRNTTEINDEIRQCLGKGIHQMMGALWRFPYVPKFIMLCVDSNTILSEKLMFFFRQVFNADLSLDQIKEIIGDVDDSNNGNTDVLYDCFVSSNLLHLSSAQRKYLGNSKYIRKGCDPIRVEVSKLEEIGNKHSSMFTDSDSTVVMKGSAPYIIDQGSVYAKVMKQFGRTLLSGPSGSTVAMFVTAFELTEMPRTSLNYALFLGCCIANYIPVYHTLTEVLMSFTDEVEEYVMHKKFRLDDDPVKYSIDFMHFNGLDFPLFPPQ